MTIAISARKEFDISLIDTTFEGVTKTEKDNTRKLLGSSDKVIKGERKMVLTKVMYLAAAKRSGYNMCPYATEGCKRLCLGHNTGKLRFNFNQLVQVKKTLFFKEYQKEFLQQLHKELEAHSKAAKSKGFVPAVRLNGTSDILWENYIDMSQYDIQFYDYTKIPLMFRKQADNYHLTYSLSEREDSMGNAVEYLESGKNVAVVVADTSSSLKKAKKVAKAITEIGYLHGYPVIDGDETDIRFYDNPGSWVVLYAKGRKALEDKTGFVKRFDLKSMLRLESITEKVR